MSAKNRKAAEEAKPEITTEAVAEEVVEAVPEEKTADVPVSKQEKSSNLVYLGPTISGVIKNNAVYKDGVLPEKVNSYIEKLPILKRLFVTLDDMTDAVKELNKDTSALRAVYTEVAQKI